MAQYRGIYRLDGYSNAAHVASKHAVVDISKGAAKDDLEEDPKGSEPVDIRLPGYPAIIATPPMMGQIDQIMAKNYYECEALTHRYHRKDVAQIRVTFVSGMDRVVYGVDGGWTI